MEIRTPAIQIYFNKTRHLSRNLRNKQSAPNPNIALSSIATKLPQGISPGNIWYVNEEVTIQAGNNLVIPGNTTLISFYPITNFGTFYNQGTFCTASTFTNNIGGKFVNNGAYTLNFLQGVLTFNDSLNTVDNKSHGQIINLQSTYNGHPGQIDGEQVVTFN